MYQNESNCPIHQVSNIIDLAVQTRARASLPATHLRIMKIKDPENLNNSELFLWHYVIILLVVFYLYSSIIYIDLLITEFGVFARKTIQKRTQFGPLEGIIVKDEEYIEEESINDEFKYLLEVDKQFRRIDVSNEGKKFK